VRALLQEKLTGLEKHLAELEALRGELPVQRKRILNGR
jgi:hypothetical protein